MSVQHPGSQDEFQKIIESAGDKLVVVDFFAVWCPPCQAIAPKIEALAAENTGVIFVKIDVDQAADAASAAGISAMPTFQFFKGGSKISEFKGADESKLISTIESLK